MAGRLDNHRDAASKKPTTTVFNASLTTPTGAATPPRGVTSVEAGTDSWATAEPPSGNDTALAPAAWIATDADGATRATEPRTAPTAGTATRAADGNAAPDSPALDAGGSSGNPADTRAPRAAAGRLTPGPVSRAASPDRATARPEGPVTAADAPGTRTVPDDAPAEVLPRGGEDEESAAPADTGEASS